jgi:hypothetical protein
MTWQPPIQFCQQTLTNGTNRNPENTMDKHNKHHKNKAKGSKQPLLPQLDLVAPLEPIIGKTDASVASGQKSKSSKGKGK